MGEIKITNKTMNLADCKESWVFNEEYQCWCLEDVSYLPNPKVPHCQRMNIFVPKVYMKENGVIDFQGTKNGYDAKTVPIIFENNSAGYMEMVNVGLGEERCYAKPYLDQGYVYISCGNRGSMSVDQDGNFCGKSPENLVDIKTAIRFLRHNKGNLPGNMERIISVGWSAGGAMSTLVGVTGNNPNFNSYLEENEAFMEESDAVFAAQIYCPIIDLDHADFAYEWMFAADESCEWTGKLTPFQKALSKKPEAGELEESSGSILNYVDGLKWLCWDGEKAKVSDLDTYVLNHRRRMKSCTSFDAFTMDSCENKVFGSNEQSMMHFNWEIGEAIGELQEEFPEEYSKYYEAYIAVKGDKELERRKYLINPLNYIGTEEKTDMAEYYRIRVGASDPDTSLSVSMTLVCKLAEAGKPADYQLVWNQPHCEADYPGEIIGWIEEIVKKLAI